MREKIYRFMMGRNGVDHFSRFLSYLALALIVLNLFVRSTAVWLLGILALAYAYFRMFSKNVYKRRDENEKFLRLQYRFTSWGKGLTERWRQRKDYKFFHCPGCRAMLRVPRGKGRIRVTCRKCGNAFEKKT